MKYQATNIREKFSQFTEQWSPKIILQMNDHHLKLARVKGDFVWHSHKDTDEVFLVIEGELRIDFKDGSVTLREGELFLVPKGIEHKPFAENECKILLIERIGTVNTGDFSCDNTITEEIWI